MNHRLAALLLAALLWTPAFLSAPCARAAQPVIVVDLSQGYLLGAWNGRWVRGAEAAALAVPGTTYDLYTLYGFGGRAVGGAAASMDEPCPDTFVVPMTLDSVGTGHVLAVSSGGRDPAVRRPTPLPVETQVYREAVAEYLKGAGIPSPEVRIEQLMRLDLEGDGVDEVLINATRLDGENPLNVRAGDYSVVLLRRLVNGRVETLLLDGLVFTGNEEFAGPTTTRVAGVLDLDNDGVLEIILGFAYYEGMSSTVFDLEQGVPTAVLIDGCGL